MSINRFKLAEQKLEKFCTANPEHECVQLFCVLHEAEYLGSHSKNSHACLGCTLNDSLEKIHNFLKDSKSGDDIEYVFTVYILLCYLLIEKFAIIFRVIGITYDYVQEKWPILIEIRKWANFIKHPKGFLFSHHAEYFFEVGEIPAEWKNYKVVNYKNVVEPLYKHEDEKKFQESMSQFANKAKLLVIIPDPLRLTTELVDACNQFCDKIKENPHFKEILKKHSVLDHYYESV